MGLVFGSSFGLGSLFFLGLEVLATAGGDWEEVRGAEGELEEDDAAAAALIRSESFSFFFFFFAGAELWDTDCEGDDGAPLCEDAAGAATSRDAFLLLFSSCDSSDASGDFFVCRAAASLRPGGVLEFAAALQCGR